MFQQGNLSYIIISVVQLACTKKELFQKILCTLLHFLSMEILDPFLWHHVRGNL